MSLDPRQLRDLVVRPALEHIGLWSLAAEQLVMGTAAQESRLTYLAQVGGGPALGLWQMEPATHLDIWANFLRFRKDLRRHVIGLLAPGVPAALTAAADPTVAPGPMALVLNLSYAAAMCRVHYYRSKAALPAEGDVAGMAKRWKSSYNSAAGAGKPEEFMRNWRLVAELYP